MILFSPWQPLHGGGRARSRETTRPRSPSAARLWTRLPRDQATCSQDDPALALMNKRLTFKTWPSTLERGRRALYLHSLFAHTQETASVLESNWILFHTEYSMAAGIANWKDKAEETRFYLTYNYVTGGQVIQWITKKQLSLIEEFSFSSAHTFGIPTLCCPTDTPAVFWASERCSGSEKHGYRRPTPRCTLQK